MSVFKDLGYSFYFPALFGGDITSVLSPIFEIIAFSVYLIVIYLT